jgi:hypothetical protein
MSISAYREGEAASLLWLGCICFAGLKRARGENRFLSVVKCNCTELFPIPNQGFLREDLVNRNPPLQLILTQAYFEAQ